MDEVAPMGAMVLADDEGELALLVGLYRRTRQHQCIAGRSDIDAQFRVEAGHEVIARVVEAAANLHGAARGVDLVIDEVEHTGLARFRLTLQAGMHHRVADPLHGALAGGHFLSDANGFAFADRGIDEGGRDLHDGGEDRTALGGSDIVAWIDLAATDDSIERRFDDRIVEIDLRQLHVGFGLLEIRQRGLDIGLGARVLPQQLTLTFVVGLSIDRVLPC